MQMQTEPKTWLSCVEERAAVVRCIWINAWNHGLSNTQHPLFSLHLASEPRIAELCTSGDAIEILLGKTVLLWLGAEISTAVCGNWTSEDDVVRTSALEALVHPISRAFSIPAF